MKSRKTVGPAVAASLVAANVAALEMSRPASADQMEKVVDDDVSPVKPPRCAE